MTINGSMDGILGAGMDHLLSFHVFVIWNGPLGFDLADGSRVESVRCHFDGRALISMFSVPRQPASCCQSSPFVPHCFGCISAI